jgi:8-amino-7-oxononanoate synthase
VTDWASELEARLEGAAKAGLERRLKPRAGTDFCSNDYLGFAQDPELARRVAHALEGEPLGAAGSRLIRGELALYERVERKLAAFSRQESALLFPSGFQANLALLSALGREGDTIYSDELNHASLIDGMRLSRAGREVYAHGDLGALRALLERDRARAGLRIIVSESLFSMDGDEAPLAGLCELAHEYGAFLVVDEAHATGLWGSGLLERRGLRAQASIHTGGKSFGAAGAWVACGATLRRYLINFARPLIFSTGPLPALAVQLEQSLAHWEEVGRERSRELFDRCARFRELTGAGAEGPIFPFVVGSNEAALEAQAALEAEGFDVRAIRPPTVAPGTARLRVTLSSTVDPGELERFARLIAPWLKGEGPSRPGPRAQARRKSGVFVTGTDTGVGKTLASALLLAASRGASYFKPVQTGDDDDTATVARLSGAGVAEPAFRFALPAAPSRAARAEGGRVSVSDILARWDSLPQGEWVVEGAGGLLVPLCEEPELLLTRELVAALGLPLVIVASTRLGTINHTALTLEAARRAGLEIRGIVLSGPEDPGLERTLRAIDPAPVLARIPMLEELTPETIRALGPELFPRGLS